MKRKWLLLSLILIAILAISTACNGGHTHSFSNDWSKDATYHWHACDDCDEVKDRAEHNYGNDNKCDDCGYEKSGETPGGNEHVHNFSNEWTNDETSHWHACDGCDEVKDRAEHNYGNDNKCDDCSYEKSVTPGGNEHVHNFSSEWTKNETSHWHACDGCDEVEDKAEHNYGNDNKCDDCDYEKSGETPGGNEHDTQLFK